MTHNELVLALLSDGEPHSHHEVYDLRVVAHSRVSALRKQGYLIDHWQADGLHWYRLRLGEGRLLPTSPEDVSRAPLAEPAPLVEHDGGQFAMDVAA